MPLYLRWDCVILWRVKIIIIAKAHLLHKAMATRGFIPRIPCLASTVHTFYSIIKSKRPKQNHGTILGHKASVLEKSSLKKKKKIT